MDNITVAQQQFLLRHRRHKRKVVIYRFLLLIGFLALWEGTARLGILNDFIFSSPSRIVTCFAGMAVDGSIFVHIGVTLGETLVSFLFVVVAGLLAALLLWYNKSVAEVAEPYLVMLNSLPKSALAPLLIVWLGNNVRTIIVAAVSVAVFGSIITLYTGFSETDPDKVKLIYSLGGTKKDVLLRVMLPGSVPQIISNMKVNIGLCLVGVIIGEFLAANKGLGYLIIYGSQVFRRGNLVIGLGIEASTSFFYIPSPGIAFYKIQSHNAKPAYSLPLAAMRHTPWRQSDAARVHKPDPTACMNQRSLIPK